MKSKAAIGIHPIHPMLVPVPVGAFFVALVGDVLHLISPRDPFWNDLSATCIGIGLIATVVAAAFGAIDYLGLRMPSTTFRLASWHVVVNGSAGLLYAVSFFVRRGTEALPHSRWPVAAVLSTLGFIVLGVGGWIGGKLVYEHRVGVPEESPEVQTPVDSRRVAS